MKSFLRASLRVASPSPQDTVFPATRFNAFRTYAMLMGSNQLTFCILGASPPCFIPAAGGFGSCFSNLALYHNSIGRPFTTRHSSRKPSTLLVSACRFVSGLGLLRASPCLRPCGFGPWLGLRLSLSASLRPCRPSLRLACLSLRRLALLRLGLAASLGGFGYLVGRAFGGLGIGPKYPLAA